MVGQREENGKGAQSRSLLMQIVAPVSERLWSGVI